MKNLTDIEIGNTNSFDISEVAYELYKQDWIDTHTTKEERLNTLNEYYNYRYDCIKEDFEIDSFEEWIWEIGYADGIYVCYEEFCDMEYHDKEYMCSLLNNKKLIDMYYKDINTDDEF